jgi:hypothetical protein
LPASDGTRKAVVAVTTALINPAARPRAGAAIGERRTRRHARWWSMVARHQGVQRPPTYNRQSMVPHKETQDVGGFLGGAGGQVGK